MKRYVCTILLLTVACSRKTDESEKAFLNGSKPGTKTVTEDAPKTEAAQEAAIVQSIKISSAEWDKMTVQVKQCEASISSENARKELEIEVAASKGRLECLKNLDELVNNKAGEALKETVSMVEEFKTELQKYKLRYALINGDCTAKMSDGHLRAVRVKGDACMSVPFIKTGTVDGEVKGIEGAVSSEAMAAGIISLTCDVGRAHLRMTNTPCGSHQGSSIKSSFDPL